jgi:hypothetical protein
MGEVASNAFRKYVQAYTSQTGPKPFHVRAMKSGKQPVLNDIKSENITQLL